MDLTNELSISGKNQPL